MRRASTINPLLLKPETGSAGVLLRQACSASQDTVTLQVR